MARPAQVQTILFGGNKSFLPLTTAYLTAVGIGNDTTVYYPGTSQQISGREIWQAVNTFESEGITGGWLALMKFVYLFIGGTATTHKYNFLNPLDADAAFRLTFFGGWTHDSLGAKPNGTNAYARTFFNPVVQGVDNLQNGLGYYSGTDLSEPLAGPSNLGAYSPAGNNYMTIGKSTTNLNTALNNGGVNYATAIMKGLFCGQKESNATTRNYLNGTAVVSGPSGSTPPSVQLMLGTVAQTSDTVPYSGGYVRNDLRLAYANTGIITTTMMTGFYTSVQKLQTALKRQA